MEWAGPVPGKVTKKPPIAVPLTIGRRMLQIFP